MSRYLMTWSKKGHRWFKEHRGKMYAVSCRQLGLPQESWSKEASREAANAWWAKKAAELSNSPAPPPDEARRAKSAYAVWSTLQGWEAMTGEEKREFMIRVVGEDKYRQIIEASQAAGGQALRSVAATEMALSAKVKEWLSLLLARAQSGNLSVGRYEAYQRHIEFLTVSIGEAASVETIDAQTLETFWRNMSALVHQRKISAAYAQTILMTAKQFITWLAEKGLIPLPGNIRSKALSFKVPVKKIEVFTTEEIAAMLGPDVPSRTKLYVLLMLNCGMYQNDIAVLRKDEINWQEGTITRPRIKTGTMIVCYTLWPETLALLQQETRRTPAGLPQAMVTEDNNPLVRYWIEAGKGRRYDTINSAWERLRQRIKVSLPMKHLRKTAATRLAEHPQYKFYANHYLADSPRNIADRHYVTPSQAEFDKALAWLRLQLLPNLGSISQHRL